MNIKDTKTSLHALKEKMKKNEKVFYVRFGDNDISNIVGYNYKGESLENKTLGNNKTIYSENQSHDIEKSFSIEHPNYLRGLVGEYTIEEGMKPHVFKYQKRNLEFINNNVRAITKSEDFYNPIVFHYYFYKRPEEFMLFIKKHVNNHKVLFVGSCENPQRLFNVNDKIKTPQKNAYSEIEKVWEEFKEKIKDHDLVIMAAGQLTRALAHRAWKLDQKFHYIDIGSLVDVLDEKNSRGWIKFTDVMKYWKNKLNY